MATQVAALEKFMRPPQNTGANDVKPQPIFAGFQKPSIDLDAVRDGRRAPLMYIDIPLDLTFTIASGNPVILPLSGNSFYIDQDTSVVGNATVHFQDTNLQSTSAPIYVGPGFIAKVPFTQLLIENKVAQAGKKLRIVYGTDVDFTAGLNATIAISSVPPTRFLSVAQSVALSTGTWVKVVNVNAARNYFTLQNNTGVTSIIGFSADNVTPPSVGFSSLLTSERVELKGAVNTASIWIITFGIPSSSAVYLEG
jgi:hypothetical protein